MGNPILQQKRTKKLRSKGGVQYKRPPMSHKIKIVKVSIAMQKQKKKHLILSVPDILRWEKLGNSRLIEQAIVFAEEIYREPSENDWGLDRKDKVLNEIDICNILYWRN